MKRGQAEVEAAAPASQSAACPLRCREKNLDFNHSID
jgi:hypothetical protein